MIKRKLKMKSVDSRYLEQYNALLRYVFQVTDQELNSVGWQEKEVTRISEHCPDKISIQEIYF